ncbi:MAG: MATE family efflux transporter [Muribaculaceae bacterium]|nr:MATE family efflux transporter [Muribaculaceae bacterium]
MKSNTIDMLTGPLLRPTLKFAIPLIATGVVQQSFNSADAFVVGRYCPSEALAAVGSNGPVINLIVTLFMGLGVGINVVTASCIGRRDFEGVRRSVATTGILSIVCGIAMAIIGMVFSRPLLVALATPAEVLDHASTYLRVMFMGLPFMMIYNFGAAILRSVGDTARPFYILVVSCLVNIGLDLLFVAKFDMGVAGVAIATAIGMALNATLVVILLLREKSDIQLVPRGMRFYRRELRQILHIGLPAGLQGLVFSLSNVFILSAINSFGSAASAGSAAALNYELYCYFLVVAFIQATVAFTSQNYAAGKIDRCKRIYRLNMILALVFCGIMNIGVVLNKGFFIGFFSTDPEVLPFAYTRLTGVLLFQFVACSYEISGGAMRALGYSMTPTIVTILGTCVFRLLWVWGLPFFGGTFATLMAVYPITWVITGVSVTVAYFVVRRKAFAKVTQPSSH